MKILKIIIVISTILDETLSFKLFYFYLYLVITIKAITTVISAISAAFIAAQGKVKYGELAEKFEHLSDTYNLLTADAYFRMTKSQITINEQLGEETVNKLVKFLEYTQDVEKNAKNGAPLPPNWITKKVERQVAKQEQESKQYQNNKQIA